MSSASAASTSTAAASKSNDNKSADTKPIILITGASRGIGLGLATEFASKFGYRVLATARTPATANLLADVVKKYPNNVQIVPLDVADEKSILALPAILRAAPFSVNHIDVVINNAGIAGKTQGKETVANAKAGDVREIFETNVVGPLLVAQVLLPFLRGSANPRLINVSSLLGSIKAANDGLFFPFSEPAYRISKAALNMLTATQASEFNYALKPAPAPGTPAAALAALAPKPAASAAPAPKVPITVVAWHPGYVASDMGKASGGVPPLSVETCTSTFAPIAHNLKPALTAVFLDWDGKTQLDW